MYSYTHIHMHTYIYIHIYNFDVAARAKRRTCPGAAARALTPRAAPEQTWQTHTRNF